MIPPTKIFSGIRFQYRRKRNLKIFACIYFPKNMSVIPFFPSAISDFSGNSCQPFDVLSVILLQGCRTHLLRKCLWYYKNSFAYSLAHSCTRRFVKSAWRRDQVCTRGIPAFSIGEKPHHKKTLKESPLSYNQMIPTFQNLQSKKFIPDAQLVYRRIAFCQNLCNFLYLEKFLRLLES